MLSESQLKDLLSKKEYSNVDKVRLCLAVDPDIPKQVKEIKELAVRNGLRAIKKWNVSQYLASKDELAVKTDAGWELTSDGKLHVQSLTGVSLGSPVVTVAGALRKVVSEISDLDTQNFVIEAIECFESHHYRAAVVLSWVGAVSVLYEFVIANRLADFNSEAKARHPKWKPAKTKDDLATMKERSFLEILVKLSIIGKSVKTELFNCLDLRNGCGHPNSLVLGEHRVAGHIEFLIQNIYSKF